MNSTPQALLNFFANTLPWLDTGSENHLSPIFPYTLTTKYRIALAAAMDNSSANAIDGSANAIHGNANAIHGSANATDGSANPIHGIANAIDGSANAIHGIANAIHGNANAIHGNTNAINSLPKTNGNHHPRDGPSVFTHQTPFVLSQYFFYLLN